MNPGCMNFTAQICCHHYHADATVASDYTNPSVVDLQTEYCNGSWRRDSLYHQYDFYRLDEERARREAAETMAKSLEQTNEELQQKIGEVINQIVVAKFEN